MPRAAPGAGISADRSYLPALMEYKSWPARCKLVVGDAWGPGVVLIFRLGF